MRRITIFGGLAALFLVIGAFAQEDHPPMPDPTPEHAWLQKLVGEWVSEGEITMQPGSPPQKSKGTEKGRMIGGFWAQLENRGDFMGQTFTGILTLGYDPGKKKYVGTWIDSVASTLWIYEGTLDAGKKKLTLETEGPSMDKPGETSKYKESIEIVSEDEKVFTSMREMDGEWVKSMTIRYTRKK